VNKNLPFIPVVYYHSIGPVNKNWNRNFLTLELPFFEDQLRYFKKHFQPVFLKEYWNMRCKKQPLIKNPIVITFDDGFLDNWIWAYPLLKKYNLKATIFVCPEMVDRREVIRPNLEDYWKKMMSYEEINQSGYLSWPEMKAMLNSGLVDIQSHTMSHTKYFVSDKLTGFHHPGNDCLYPVGNLFPDLKPYHIADHTFETQIPYGYPLFEEISSVSARRVTINESFTEECIKDLKHYDFDKYSFNTAFNEVTELYDEYKSDGLLVTEIESDDSIRERLNYEIIESRRILEEKLNTSIEFLCWPHGDNTETAHQLAINAGYLATTMGSKIKCPDSLDRISDRIGMWHVRNNRFLSNLKTRYKIGSSVGLFPYKQINVFYNMVRYRKSKI
jgi:hypothetical protein